MRQADCAVRAGVHRSTWSLLESGRLDRISLPVLRLCLAVLEVRLDLVPRWRGTDLERLLDEGHAALQAAWKTRLELRKWQVWVERSFSVYGDRGRIDLFGWHPETATVLMVEIKTELANSQELLGSVDLKVRLAPRVARDLDLPPPARVVPMIVFQESMTTRRQVARLAPLFAAFSLRGSAALAWLRRPGAASGLLLFTDADARRVRGVAKHRVRLARPEVSVEPPGGTTAG